MSGKTKIEWTEATWNCITGCSKVSQGCRFCYAEREWPRLAAPREKPNIYTGRDFTDVRCHPEKLNIPLRWTKPRRIFVNSMSDLFHEAVPDEFIHRVFGVMASAEQHIFQVLTKRPERMLAFVKSSNRPVETRFGWYFGGPFPLRNVWLGVSVEDQATADERIPVLLQTPAAVRWISAEPLLGPVNLANLDAGDGTFYSARTGEHWDVDRSYRGNVGKLNWVVAGGESGPKARPSHSDWFRGLRDQCQVAGVPFFMKQITDKGRKVPFEQWPDDLRVREYPS